MSSARSEFIAGVRAELPIVVGAIPFGIIYGVLAVNAGIPPLIAIAMSSIVFAGSAQFVAAQLIGAGIPALVLWLTTFIINIRHMLYSASLAPYAQRLSRPWKWLLAYLLTDEAYVVTALHYEATPSNNYQHYFWLGSGLMLWVSWQLSTIIGVVFGTQIPASWSLDYTLALTFIGMVVPLLKSAPSRPLDRPMFAAAVSAGIVALLTFTLPYKLGLMLAALTGIVVGVWLENQQLARKGVSQ